MTEPKDPDPKPEDALTPDDPDYLEAEVFDQERLNKLQERTNKWLKKKDK